MLLEQTIQKLTKMRLFGMADSLKQRLSRPDHADLPVSDLIGLVVDDEWTSRENRLRDQRLKAAHFKDKSACMENIDYRPSRGLNKSALLELAQCRWLEEHQNLALVGPTGAGKSYLAQALGNQACRLGSSVLYVRVPKLFEQVALARAEGSYPQLMRRFARTRLLILDDFGLSVLPDQDRRDLLEIVEERHKSGSTAITSQLPVESWHECFGGGVVADALCDRLLHNCLRIELLGESLRQEGHGQEPTKGGAEDGNSPQADASALTKPTAA